MTRIVIVDDHPAVRAGLANLLDAEDDLSVEAVTATAGEAQDAVERLRPDVLVADYHLPDLDGLSLCLRLADTPVVLYSAFADEAVEVLALVAGARAVVSKTADPNELLAAVRGRTAPLDPRPAALREAGSRVDPDDLPILGMLANDVPVGEIAATLSIDEDWLTARRWAVLQRLRGRRMSNEAIRTG